MHDHWINPSDYTMDCFLLFDRWVLRMIFNEQYPYPGDYITDMAKALSQYPYIDAFCRIKAPETIPFLNKTRSVPNSGWTDSEMRKAETAILQALETSVVYAYPEVMETVNYIRDWNPVYLYELVSLEDKIVLDVGAGTGRLAFAAAKKARRVYASEPCDQLREYMRDRIHKEGITNIKVLDGIVTCLPYEDNTFDAVLSGHVIGDDYDREIAELTRVTKNGGDLVICNGEDEFCRSAPNHELVTRGFSWFSHKSINGGTVYNYRKQIIKD
ncbi:MAG: class I SAM-dependent methyltransferase [Ruminococcaceae bacterium]|nr:class I SAM-dependent methyltransferase [Oscillospiraceae bacterium]